MNRAEFRQQLTVEAAGWCHDNPDYFRVIFGPEDCRQIMNPGYWDSIGDDNQFGSRHNYQVRCRKPGHGSKGSLVEILLGVLRPEQAMFIAGVTIYASDPSYDGGVRPININHDFETGPLRQIRTSEIRNRAFNAVVKWYKSVYNILEDSDMGTEEQDWEVFSQAIRADEKCSDMVIELLRMPTRTAEYVETSFIKPGIVSVSVPLDPEDEPSVTWKVRPEGEFAMTGLTQENTGGWA